MEWLCIKVMQYGGELQLNMHAGIVLKGGKNMIQHAAVLVRTGNLL